MKNQNEENLFAIERFIKTPLATRLAQHQHVATESYTVELAKAVAQEVPAYQAFLRGHGVNLTDIRTMRDFRNLPLMTKQDYVHAYPLNQRCRGGELAQTDMIAVSSGSTGLPIAWPRTLKHELDIAYRFEHVFRESFQAHQSNTLAVVCFPLGTWVGGMFTADCCRHLAMKGYPLTVVTPGNNAEEIFRVVETLGPAYQQVVLLGYPPFVKGVVDQGIARGMDWSRYYIKFVFAGEVFSEEWRDIVCERVAAKDPVYDTASLYGTADAGVLGNETPLSIVIRRFFAHRPEAARAVFGESHLPTLVQYDPTSRYFELHDNTLVVSGDNGAPLVRYHIADKGGIFSYDDMLACVRDAGGDTETLQAGRNKEHYYSLPFVYVFGRADFTVSYYGANIYPENVTVGLEQPIIRNWVTGKFVLQVTETENHDECLHVVVELSPSTTASEERRSAIAASIKEQLLRLNSEFANYVPSGNQTPDVQLTPTGDPEWFPVGVKHRYTRRR